MARPELTLTKILTSLKISSSLIATPYFEPIPRPSPRPFINLEFQIIKNVKIDFHFVGEVLEGETEMTTASSDLLMICFCLD